MTYIYFFLTIIFCCMLFYLIHPVAFIIILCCCCVVYYIYFRCKDIKLEFVKPYCEKGGRNENQDHIDYSSVEEKYCFVIADGLGGHRGGKLAATIAVDTVLEHFKKFKHVGGTKKTIDESVNSFLRDSLLKAHNNILEKSNNNPKFENMKSTCVILVIANNYAYFTNIGDSRIYFIKNCEVMQKSKDHSVVQVMLDMNEISEEEIVGHPDRNRVLKVLGMEEDFTIHTLSRKIEKGEYILLCTDGFWEYFTVKDIELFFQSNSEKSVKDLQDCLYESTIEKANEFSEKFDNITIQLIKAV
ncbi:protein serine/threonine phosphatase [Candidatus Magnetomorum sp. HK-1]|nr:protein serine/threonine phosphatase [Candidatus Magnetomorum sp. HK-1]